MVRGGFWKGEKSKQIVSCRCQASTREEKNGAWVHGKGVGIVQGWCVGLRPGAATTGSTRERKMQKQHVLSMCPAVSRDMADGADSPAAKAAKAAG